MLGDGVHGGDLGRARDRSRREGGPEQIDAVPFMGRRTTRSALTWKKSSGDALAIVRVRLVSSAPYEQRWAQSIKAYSFSAARRAVRVRVVRLT